MLGGAPKQHEAAVLVHTLYFNYPRYVTQVVSALCGKLGCRRHRGCRGWVRVPTVSPAEPHQTDRILHPPGSRGHVGSSVGLST